MDSDDEGDWAKAAEAEAAESKRMSEKTPLLSPGAQQGSPVPQHMVAQQQQQMAFATVSADNKIIAERNKEFQGLAEDIVVLRDAAEDMSQLVGTQGEDLKHVKESTTHAVDDVEEGATQLKQVPPPDPINTKRPLVGVRVRVLGAIQESLLHHHRGDRVHRRGGHCVWRLGGSWGVRLS
eukprot:TRINITY_DN4958_c0_g1_i1.p1 TRINITY_DN4958_c0_g1~~TRINITY_DN4958_c0_g1_i1.p1  ORF type:complete len:180 (-),score=39.32 TRINITY_DN4958_c0_g1_i1:48-587(-)